MLIYIQDRLSSLQGEDLLAFITQFSPKPPDTITFIWALSSIAAGMLLVFIWRRRQFQMQHLLCALAVGSLLWCGLFCFRVLVPHLFDPSIFSSRESFESDFRTELNALLWEARKAVPDCEGIVLINCGSPREVEWTQYILYPRRIFLESYSTAVVKDPVSFLTHENRKLLMEKGIDWAMNLAPSAVRGGKEKSLINIRREAGN